jgi:hypothetical protein
MRWFLDMTNNIRRLLVANQFQICCWLLCYLLWIEMWFCLWFCMSVKIGLSHYGANVDWGHDLSFTQR